MSFPAEHLASLGLIAVLATIGAGLGRYRLDMGLALLLAVVVPTSSLAWYAGLPNVATTMSFALGLFAGALFRWPRRKSVVSVDDTPGKYLGGWWIELNAPALRSRRGDLGSGRPGASCPSSARPDVDRGGIRRVVDVAGEPWSSGPTRQLYGRSADWPRCLLPGGPEGTGPSRSGSPVASLARRSRAYDPLPRAAMGALVASGGPARQGRSGRRWLGRVLPGQPHPGGVPHAGARNEHSNGAPDGRTLASAPGRLRSPGYLRSRGARHDDVEDRPCGRDRRRLGDSRARHRLEAPQPQGPAIFVGGAGALCLVVVLLVLSIQPGRELAGATLRTVGAGGLARSLGLPSSERLASLVRAREAISQRAFETAAEYPVAGTGPGSLAAGAMVSPGEPIDQVPSRWLDENAHNRLLQLAAGFAGRWP